jgi:hypothetical protein
MSAGKQMTEIVENYVKHAEVDYVGLWQIAGRVRDAMGLSDNRDIRGNTLSIVKDLLERGLRPGDYLKTGFQFWNERDVASIIARIEEEWDPAEGDPTLVYPICWFGKK